jgi:hypothetical protein
MVSPFAKMSRGCELRKTGCGIVQGAGGRGQLQEIPLELLQNIFCDEVVPGGRTGPLRCCPQWTRLDLSYSGLKE